MSGGPRPPGPPRHVPTLTEVLDPSARPSAPMPAPLADAELARRVMAELHRRLDDTLEPRLRAAIAPAVEAVAGALLTEARAMLDDLLHQAVREAVAKELARRGETPPR